MSASKTFLCGAAAALALAPYVSPDAGPGSPPTARHALRFTDVTVSAGLSGFEHVSGSEAKDYIFETTGAGAAFLDYDGDGWLDIYLPNGGTLEALRGRAPFPAAALFRNDGSGRFVDVTARAGVANHRWAQGVCAGDYDNDGRLDLYVTNIGENRLYRNRGDGTFEDVAPAAGVLADGWSTGCAFGDYDRDGWLDLFVAGYVDLDFDRLPPPATGPAITSSAGAPAEPTSVGAAYVPDAGACHYRGVRVMCGPRGLKGARDFLFRNNGDGTFTDVSLQAGVGGAHRAYGFGVAWTDYDDDGWLDLLVANDSTASYVYRNRGDGTFADESLLSGAALTEDGREQAGMGIAIADYDGDGRLDVHRTNFADDANVLYRNEGGSFVETTWRAGLGFATLPFVGWGTVFADLDHDGWPDLVVANGHVYPVVDRYEWGTRYRQRMSLFRNVHGRFDEVTALTGDALSVPRAGRGLAAGDYDNDGDLDLLVSSLDGAPALLRNDGGAQAGHWLSVTLAGSPAAGSPRDAIGSIVTAVVDGRRLRGEVASGRSFNSQSDLRVHFGLGTAEELREIEVRWPNGERRRYAVGRVNRFITIDQRTGVR
jgi:enediyne biosynthesis protein E4